MKNPLIKLLLLSSILFAVIANILQTYDNIFVPDFELSDCQSYRNAAHYLFFENLKPHPTRPPIFPFFIGLPYLFKASPSFCTIYVMVFNFICHLLTIAVLFKILEKIVGEKAFYVSLLYACNIGSIVINNQTLTEPLYTLCLVAIAYFFQKYILHKSFKDILWAYLLLCLSILIRPTLLPLFWVASIGVLYFIYQQKERFKYGIIALSIPLSILGSHAYKMKVHYGKPTISFIGPLAYFTYLTPYADQYDKYPDWQARLKAWEIAKRPRMNLYERRDTVSNMDWVGLTSTAQHELITTLQTKPRALGITYIHHVISNCVAYSMMTMWLENIRKEAYFDAVKKIALPITRLQNTVYSSAFLVLLPFLLFSKKIKKEEKQFILLIGLIGLTIIFVSGISITQGDRFHIVFAPLALILLSYGFNIYRFTK
jgi:hypothetical protein